MAAPGPFSSARDGVRVALKVTPGAKSTAIGGVEDRADGGCALKVGVTAAAESGKANAAVTALLARAWRLPKTSLTIERGVADRRKLLHIATADPAALVARLETWLKEPR